MVASSENVSTAIQDVAQGIGSQSEDLFNITSILNIFGKSSENIIESIQNIDSNSKEIQSETNTSSHNMNSLISSVNKVLTTFENLTIKVSALSQNINQINEINIKIDTVTSASSEEVATSAQTLGNLTKEMMEQVNKFKL